MIQANPYQQLWLKAKKEGQVSLPCGDAASLERLRWRLYNSVRSHRNKETELGQAAREVSLTLDKKTFTITLTHYSQEGTSQIVAQALGHTPQTSATPAALELVPAEIEEMARRALQKVNEIKDEGKTVPYYRKRGE